MESSFLIIVFSILIDFSSFAYGARHISVNVSLESHKGNDVQKFEEKHPTAFRNPDASNHHRSSFDTLPRSQKEKTNYLKPMPILENDKLSITIETRGYDHDVRMEENIESKEVGRIHGGGDIEVMDYAPPRGKPPIHNQEP